MATKSKIGRPRIFAPGEQKVLMLYLHPRQNDKLRAMASAHDMSCSAFVRQWIDAAQSAKSRPRAHRAKAKNR